MEVLETFDNIQKNSNVTSFRFEAKMHGMGKQRQYSVDVARG